jgi:hypothetical protein
MVLTFVEGLPAGRQECPGCGALFEWDEATGVIVHFYREGEPRPDAEPIPNPEDEPTTGEGAAPERSAPELIADLRQKVGRLEQPDTDGRRRRLFRRTFFAAAAVAGAWVFINGFRKDGSQLKGLLVDAAIAGAVVGALAWILVVFGVTAFDGIVEFIHDFRSGQREKPDLERFAGHLRPDVVRRPLPATEPAREPNTMTTADPPAAPGPDTAVTPTPPGLSITDNPDRAAGGRA